VDCEFKNYCRTRRTGGYNHTNTWCTRKRIILQVYPEDHRYCRQPKKV
jgi:hypothetical protein